VILQKCENASPFADREHSELGWEGGRGGRNVRWRTQIATLLVLAAFSAEGYAQDQIPASSQGSFAPTVRAPLRIPVNGNWDPGRMISQVQVAYPPGALRKGVHGDVVLDAIVGTDGKVSKVSVISGDPLLVPAAVEAVSRWQYKQTLVNGVPVELDATVTVTSVLGGKPTAQQAPSSEAGAATGGVPAPVAARASAPTAQSIRDAAAALKSGDVAALRRKAESGDPAAETELCMAYARSDAIAEDDAQSVLWCRRAADQGFAPGEEGVGLSYRAGRGVERDPLQAVAWFQKAAAQQSTYAMNLLGTMYANADGIPQDFGKAMEWYQKAADLGDPKSDFDVGVIYLEGQGVKQDTQEGLDWVQRAVDLKFSYAEFALAGLYQDGTMVPRDLPKSVELFREAAEQGLAPAQTELGWIYAHGVGVQLDYVEAAKWYQKGAEQGDTKAAYGLGVRYMLGQGVARDYSAAEKWFIEAAEGGNGDAQYNLGGIYLNEMPDENRTPDPARAAHYLSMAANQNVADAQYSLGTLYAAGNGVKQDNVAAFMWLSLGEKNGNPNSAAALNELEKKMSPQDIAEGKSRVESWQPASQP